MEEEKKPAIAPPPDIDPYWREKIAIAKRERESARKANKGKPKVFNTNPSLYPRK